MTIEVIADGDAEMTGGGNFACIFSNPRAAWPVDCRKEFAISGLLNRPHKGAAHAPTDAANDQT